MKQLVSTVGKSLLLSCPIFLQLTSIAAQKTNKFMQLFFGLFYAINCLTEGKFKLRTGCT